MTDHSDLRAKALAATPGPWAETLDGYDAGHWDCDHEKQVWSKDADSDDAELLECNDEHYASVDGPFVVDRGDFMGLSDKNAAYIAALSPDVALQLLSTLGSVSRKVTLSSSASRSWRQRTWHFGRRLTQPRGCLKGHENDG